MMASEMFSKTLGGGDKNSAILLAFVEYICKHKWKSERM
jgi:hypothetical protein